MTTSEKFIFALLMFYGVVTLLITLHQIWMQENVNKIADMQHRQIKLTGALLDKELERSIESLERTIEAEKKSNARQNNKR